VFLFKRESGNIALRSNATVVLNISATRNLIGSGRAPPVVPGRLISLFTFLLGDLVDDLGLPSDLWDFAFGGLPISGKALEPSTCSLHLLILPLILSCPCELG
jgi:hypothetical protein